MALEDGAERLELGEAGPVVGQACALDDVEDLLDEHGGRNRGAQDVGRAALAAQSAVNGGEGLELLLVGPAPEEGRDEAREEGVELGVADVVGCVAKIEVRGRVAEQDLVLRGVAQDADGPNGRRVRRLELLDERGVDRSAGLDERLDELARVPDLDRAASELDLVEDGREGRRPLLVGRDGALGQPQRLDSRERVEDRVRREGRKRFTLLGGEEEVVARAHGGVPGTTAFDRLATEALLLLPLDVLDDLGRDAGPDCFG